MPSAAAFVSLLPVWARVIGASSLEGVCKENPVTVAMTRGKKAPPPSPQPGSTNSVLPEFAKWPLVRCLHLRWTEDQFAVSLDEQQGVLVLLRGQSGGSGAAAGPVSTSRAEQER